MLQIAPQSLRPEGVRDYFARQEHKSLLRFLTCGSVDDGKSTLIGRLLYDTKLIYEDQLSALERDSRRHGTTGADLDLALLVDGLEAEREQGITIDVAYRFFSTEKRKFIVADTPGHEEYTRNMATGASTADLAVMLVDARQGLLPQTRRHSVIASLLGIRHIVLAVNKIDLIEFDENVFQRIAKSYESFAATLGFRTITPIPIAARWGDNVTTRSVRTPWHAGPTLLEHLEAVDVEPSFQEKPFRFPIQYVNRPDLDFRGYAGTVASGSVRVGDAVVVAKSGRATTVRRIVGAGHDLQEAIEGQAATLVLEDEIEAARGDMLAAPKARPHVADGFAAQLVWFGEQPLLPGRAYLLRTETDEVGVTVTELSHRLDIHTLAEEQAKSLAINEVGAVKLSTQAPIAFDAFAASRATGGFVLIDRLTNGTIAAGMILNPLRRAANIHRQALDVTKARRAALKNQTPAVLWFTGLSGSGKSTVANLLERRLHAAGHHTYLLDGDNIRHGLNRDLGFSDADRVENIRRVAEVAKLMADAGLIVLVSFISPFRAEREMARGMLEQGEFVEVFIDTPLDECARRDPKGLYAKARSGEIRNFTGINSPYEAPESPELHLRTIGRSPEELAEAVEDWLAERETTERRHFIGDNI